MYLAAVVPQSLQVLCFGNSLTQGWPSLHPYEIALKAHIEDRLVPSTEVDTYNWGQGGDRVVQGPGGGQYYPRINEAYTKQDYDWAVILGGTNDIGGGLYVEDIWEALQDVWEVALSNGSDVVALTIPARGEDPTKEYERKTIILNERIRSYQPRENPEKFHVYDLYHQIPFDPDYEADSALWDDAVHFSAHGYDVMGRGIADIIMSVLRKEPSKKEAAAQKPLLVNQTDGSNASRTGTHWKYRTEM